MLSNHDAGNCRSAELLKNNGGREGPLRRITSTRTNRGHLGQLALRTLPMSSPSRTFRNPPPVAAETRLGFRKILSALGTLAAATMLVKEYRICMPLTVEEYRIGQLYTICKHSHEVSEKGEGVEVVRNETHIDPVHGRGQLTEKRVHLSSKLPGWARAVVPRIFYITEKSWNYYPYTVTEYTCSFLPKFSIHIETKYEDNCGINENIFGMDCDYEVDFLDIAFDDVPDRHNRSCEDPKHFSSVKTGRGPLKEGWRGSSRPVMCSYKQVEVQFEVWGLQTRVEQFVHKVIRDILLVGHRQAFTWLDEWYGMTLEDVRRFESQMHLATNQKLGHYEA
ncbi:hypothetical protein AAFF_G00266170 [Aldrovandia affinis]|uniref:Cytoplasmic phosphatidylinositol transfer protein 1 n=1 Tax=Aldrovandia affinis TaxID=143900 RepID=A0AAD7RB94_9TELE|nr:hypothetical protein AAFF_G00266170 [Aldrovandia affinis]